MMNFKNSKKKYIDSSPHDRDEAKEVGCDFLFLVVQKLALHMVSPHVNMGC
jgi:hypothetical protein